MKLYLVRHAKPLPKEVDPDNHLSEEGELHAVQLGAFLKDIGIKVDAIKHSGIIRAQETAEILAKALDASLAQMDGLHYDDDVTLIPDQLGDKDLMLVGHNPFMSKLAAFLIFGKAESGLINVDTCTCICLTNETERGNWKLLFSVSPDLFK